LTGILSDIQVIELTHGASGSFCAKLLADQGADTIKVEPPGWGDTARHEPPFVNGTPDFDGSSTFLAFNTNKKGVTLDVTQTEGRKLFLSLLQSADVMIESSPPGTLNKLALGYDVLAVNNPKLILASLTYFGQNGPKSSYNGNDLVSQATGGYLHAVTGSADKPPMGTTLQQMELTSARNGAIAIMTALFKRKETGTGLHIDISQQEAAVSTPSGLIHPYTFTGRNPRRGGSDGNVMDGMHLPTKDGEVTLTTAGTGGRPMEAWADFLQEPRLTDPKFATRQSRLENWEELHDLVAPRLSEWNNLDLMQETMSLGLVIGLVQSPKQVVESPHLEERGYFVEIEHETASRLKYPGSGFLMDGINTMENRLAAPTLGQHNVEIFTGKLGISLDELAVLRASHVI